MPFLPLDGAPPSSHAAMADTMVGLGSIERFRAANTPLPLHSQELIDRVPVQVGLDRLAILGWLMAKGLTKPIPNWLARTEWYWEMDSEMGEVQETMTPDARPAVNLPDRIGARIPIYCTLSHWAFGIRELEQSRLFGSDLDTTAIANGNRRMNERMEETLINGGTVQANGGLTVPGLLNAPNAATYPYKSSLAWDDPTKTGPDIVDDVLGMIGRAQANKRYGPYALWVPTTYGVALGRDYKALGSDSILTRLLQISDGTVNGKLTVNVADRLPANRTILIQATDDVVDVGIGQEPTNMTWTDNPGFKIYGLTIACVIPRVKTDYAGKSGIVIGYTS